MKNQDRQEILTQLQDAFGMEEQRQSRITTEILRIDNHNVARVTQIKEPSIEEQLYAKYPEAVSVREMINILENNYEPHIKESGRRLRKMLIGAFGDEAMIQKLVKACREYQTKFYGTPDSIRKQLLLYYFVSEIEAS